jgi:hypothetical protein
MTVQRRRHVLLLEGDLRVDEQVERRGHIARPANQRGARIGDGDEAVLGGGAADEWNAATGQQQRHRHARQAAPHWPQSSGATATNGLSGR